MVGGDQGVVVKAHSGHDPRREVVDHHVALRREFERQRAPARRAKIQRDAAFVWSAGKPGCVAD